MKELLVRNRQRERRVDVRCLKRVAVSLLEELLALHDYELGIHFVSESQMARLNERYLRHTGATDVITFDSRAMNGGDGLSGELYICVAVAERQAREFRTTWQSELVRYLTHGVLHLLGYDDLTSEKRKVMKREENRLVRVLEKRFDFDTLATE